MSFSCLVYVAASDYDALRRQYDALTQENERLRKQVKEFKRGR